MTDTEELRRLLDELGVEWHDTKIGKGFITVFEHDGITWIVTEQSSGRLSVKGCVKPTQGHYDGMTPAQAIAATLGVEPIEREPDGWYKCPKCGCVVGYDELYGGGWAIVMDDYQIPFNHCPSCGRKVEDV